MNHKTYFESEKYDFYFQLILVFFTIAGYNIYLWLILLRDFSLNNTIDHPFLSILLIGMNLLLSWILYIFIKEHCIYKANFVATPEN